MALPRPPRNLLTYTPIPYTCGAPSEQHYSYNASGPDPDATGIWDAHIHRDVPRGDPQVYGTPIYTWGPHMRSIIPTMLLDPPEGSPG